MAPTVCLADIPERPRVPFTLDTHLINTKSIYSEGLRSLTTIHRRRLHRVFRIRDNKVRTILMGLVVEDDCDASVGQREADSPELQYTRNSGAVAAADSIESGRTWRPDAQTCSQQHMHMLRRRDGLLDITLRTMALLRRNQQLQCRLSALQAETRAFVQSVLNNPENSQQNEDNGVNSEREEEEEEMEVKHSITDAAADVSEDKDK